MKRARIMLSGEVGKALKVEDAHIAVTTGARASREAAGGQVIDISLPEKGRLQKKEKPAETA
jgi:ribosomal protein L15